MATELSDIKGVGPSTITALENAGLDSLQSLAGASIEDIESAGIGTAKAEKILQRAKESAVIVQTARERQAEYESRDKVPTGIPLLDNLIDGGWEAENLICVYGRSDSGKTQIGFQSAVSCIEETGGPVVYIETERNRFRPERLVQIAGGDESILDDIIAVKAFDLDTQYNAYSMVANEYPEAKLVIIDSFNGRFRISGEFDGRGTFSSRSHAMGAHITAIEKMAERLACPVLMTAQIYDSPQQYGGRDIPYGGNVFLHMVTYLVYLKPSTGDLRELRIEGHPSKGEGEIHLNITADGVMGMKK